MRRGWGNTLVLQVIVLLIEIVSRRIGGGGVVNGLLVDKLILIVVSGSLLLSLTASARRGLVRVRGRSGKGSCEFVVALSLRLDFLLGVVEGGGSTDHAGGRLSGTRGTGVVRRAEMVGGRGKGGGG